MLTMLAASAHTPTARTRPRSGAGASGRVIRGGRRWERGGCGTAGGRRRGGAPPGGRKGRAPARGAPPRRRLPGGAGVRGRGVRLVCVFLESTAGAARSAAAALPGRRELAVAVARLDVRVQEMPLGLGGLQRLPLVLRHLQVAIDAAVAELDLERLAPRVVPHAAQARRIDPLPLHRLLRKW